MTRVRSDVHVGVQQDLPAFVHSSWYESVSKAMIELLDDYVANIGSVLGL